MNHLIAYPGINVSLAVLQKEYGEEYAPWPNKRTDINGTLQRAPYYPEDFDDFVDRCRASKGKMEAFAVLQQEEDTFRYIGHTGIHDITWPDGTGETGSIFGAENSRQKGFGTEAKLLLQYHAFMILGLRKLHSGVKAFNAQSLGHLLKCGYQIVGRNRQEHFHEGSYVDGIILECFREDWEPIWDTYQKEKSLPKLSDIQREMVRIETKQA